MSFKKIANAELVDPILSLADWGKMYGQKVFGRKSASLNKFADNQTKYLLSHATIMASVAVEKSPFDYFIRPATSAFVNSNDDAWSNGVLKMASPSFVGAFNFVEHFQNSKFAKGHILSQVLRKIHLGSDPEDWIYFCDILVATDLRHRELAEDIRSGKVKYMSMGCVTDLVICSFCGAHVTDQSNYCTHLQYQKGTFLVDDDGISRKVAELCGHPSLPNGGVKFVEASWVNTPAFPGAVKRNIVADEWVGPATKFTTPIKSASFSKAANNSSDNSVGDALLDFDFTLFR
jgi:hypothetical protein